MSSTNNKSASNADQPLNQNDNTLLSDAQHSIAATGGFIPEQQQALARVFQQSILQVFQTSESQPGTPTSIGVELRPNTTLPRNLADEDNNLPTANMNNLMTPHQENTSALRNTNEVIEFLSAPPFNLSQAFLDGFMVNKYKSVEDLFKQNLTYHKTRLVSLLHRANRLDEFEFFANDLTTMGCFIEYIQSYAADGTSTPSEGTFDAGDFEDYIADRMLDIDEEMFTQ